MEGFWTKWTFLVDVTLDSWIFFCFLCACACMERLVGVGLVLCTLNYYMSKVQFWKNFRGYNIVLCIPVSSTYNAFVGNMHEHILFLNSAYLVDSPEILLNGDFEICVSVSKLVWYRVTLVWRGVSLLDLLDLLTYIKYDPNLDHIWHVLLLCWMLHISVSPLLINRCLIHW